MTDGFASRYARTLGATMVAGLVAGFVAAGIGSRLTMRILAVTTHPLPAGFRTEAEAQVGKITTGGTVFLLLIGAVLGAGGALLYLALRRWLPGSGWSRGIVFGLLLVALLGRKVVDPGNKDFQFLTPKPLALALFSSLFIAFGLLVVPLVERFDRAWMDGGQWIARLPQEDFCQALGYPPDKKYEKDGGPGMEACLRLLDGGADAGTKVRLGGDNLLQPQAREALHDQAQTAVGQLEHLVNVGRSADGVQVLARGLFDRGIALREHRDQLSVRNRIVDQADRALAGDGERHERIGEEDGVAKRQDRQLGRNRQRPVADRDVLRLEVLDLIAHETPRCGLRTWDCGLIDDWSIRNRNPQSAIRNGKGRQRRDGLRYRRSP